MACANVVRETKAHRFIELDQFTIGKCLSYHAAGTVRRAVVDNNDFQVIENILFFQ